MQLQQQFELPRHSHSGIKFVSVTDRKSKIQKQKERQLRIKNIVDEYNELVKKSKREKLSDYELNHAKELMTEMRSLGLFCKLFRM